jgi:hypothetical protein
LLHVPMSNNKDNTKYLYWFYKSSCDRGSTNSKLMSQISIINVFSLIDQN